MSILGYKRNQGCHFILLVALLFSLTQCNKLNSLILEYKEKRYERMMQKPEKVLQVADKLFDEGYYYSAINHYQRVIDTLKPGDLYARHQLATSYRMARDYANAVPAYQDVVDGDEDDRYLMSQYWLGVMLKMDGQYDAAIEALEIFKESDGFNKHFRSRDFSTYREFVKKVDNHIAGAEYALEAMKKPEDVNIFQLDRHINSAYTEMSPLPWEDTLLVYASMRSDTVIVTKYGEREPLTTAFYQSFPQNRATARRDTLKGPFNKKGVHTGNGALSPDGARFYFTRCKPEAHLDHKIVCAIYKSELKDGNWQAPEKLSEAINHPDYTSTHPTVGTLKRGGREFEVLYFSSDREERGARGGMDIWYAMESFRGGFGAPRNLGRTVNTEGDEVSPFFHEATNTLYFSSDGHPGMGGLDIFKTEGKGRRWSEPENLGYPINSSVDDMYYVQRSETQGYLVSNRIGSIALKSPTCCDDIYGFKYLHMLNFAVRGHIYNARDTLRETPMEGVTLNLYRLEAQKDDTGAVLQREEIMLTIDTTSHAKADSGYYFRLKEGRKYRITAYKEGFLVDKIDVSTVGLEESDTQHFDLVLEEIEKQKAMVVQNIFYEFDKASLKEASKPALDSLSIFLKDNAQLIVEISSHTDSVGSSAYNMQLSQQRAERVVSYLINSGIAEDRLVAKGYGKTQPIAPNTKPDGSDNPEGRAKNRRTAFKIIGELEGIELEYRDNFIYEEPDELHDDVMESYGRDTKENLLFRIQVGAYSKPLPDDSKLYDKVDELEEEILDDGVIRYITGSFNTLSTAIAHRQKLQRKGIKDAFVVPYYKGARISRSDLPQLFEE